MADGRNGIRALRISEIITDFRNIVAYILQINPNASAEEYNEEGFAVLRRCLAEARALLAAPFQQNVDANPQDEERIRQQLRRIIVDAAVRRFRAQKIYLLATAALRWVNARNVILRGQRPHAGHAPALLQIRNILRAELASVTDARVQSSIHTSFDTGKWTDEDPPLQIIQRIIANGNGR